MSTDSSVLPNSGRKMKILWRDLKSIEELDWELWSIFPQRNLLDVRRTVRIVVIDDKGFSPLQNLQQHQFNITHLSDVTSIDAIRDYHVALVDLQGVGRELNPTQEGAHLIREIKTHYPDKYIIAYTAGGAPELLAPSIQVADKFTQKDTAIEDWCELLDDGARSVVHPAILWRKHRHRLLDKGVTPFQLACLEDALVRALMDDPQTAPAKLESESTQLNLSSDVRATISSLIASALFSLLG